MNRRTFLAGAGRMSLALAAAPAFPALYRPAPRKRILKALKFGMVDEQLNGEVEPVPVFQREFKEHHVRRGARHRTVSLPRRGSEPCKCEVSGWIQEHTYRVANDWVRVDYKNTCRAGYIGRCTPCQGTQGGKHGGFRLLILGQKQKRHPENRGRRIVCW